MKSSKSELICNLEKSNKYLSQKVATEPRYGDLIKTLNAAIDTLKKVNKPIVKIVSPSATLTTNLKEKNQANPKLRSLYDFQVISPIQKPYKITINCDVICLAYKSSQNILKAHQRLIELAEQKNISLILLVQQEINAPYANLSDWLTAQNYSQVNKVLLPLDDFMDLDDRHHISMYQWFLLQLSATVQEKFEARSIEQSVTKIKHFFTIEITDSWRIKKQINDTYFQGYSIYQHRQKNRQYFNKINREKQQALKYIQQHINQSRNDYLNPFMTDSWIFTIQQIIQQSQIKVVQEADETYLYLTIERSNFIEYIHSYILGLCQQKITEALASQWSKINYVYGGGGLQALVNKMNTELEIINSLCPSEIDLPEINLITEQHPSLELAQIIDPHCLKANSRIIFDYSYTQSTWFRLLISVLVGMGIYLITKLYFGTGKYIGFFILIVQIINLFTNQDIRTIKLKQHKKELQRTIDNKYQNLIRMIVDKLIQTLIINLDRSSQLYQQQIDAIDTLINTQSEEIQQTINQHKLRIENLKQDREKILSWFDEVTQHK